MKLLAITFFILFIGFSPATAQQQPFQKDIAAFKKADKIRPPVKNGILFIGSSSFARWTDLEHTFRSYSAINRGFGGSTLANAIYYADDIIFPYSPRQIVIYSGENDIAEGAGPEVTFDRFKILFSLIRKKLPQVPIAFISIKPSISREKFMPQMVRTNSLIKKFLSENTKTAFIDVYPLMLQQNGRPMNDIFVEDRLHMNKKGYDIWIKAIRPYLIASN